MDERNEYFEPGLEVASDWLDNSARIEVISREPGERSLTEIVERGEAALARRTNVNVRAVGIAVPIGVGGMCLEISGARTLFPDGIEQKEAAQLLIACVAN